jgi:hypothetical protein
VFMYFFRVCAGGGGGVRSFSRCWRGFFLFFSGVGGVFIVFSGVCRGPTHTLKEYMNTGTHSEEVHKHRHTL